MMTFRLIVTLILLLISISSAWAGSDVNGIVLERGTRKPLEGVNVYILPHKLKATTGVGGLFEFKDLPDGEFSWVVNHSGYRKLDAQDEAVGENFHRTLYV